MPSQAVLLAYNIHSFNLTSGTTSDDVEEKGGWNSILQGGIPLALQSEELKKNLGQRKKTGLSNEGGDSRSRRRHSTLF